MSQQRASLGRMTWVTRRRKASSWTHLLTDSAFCSLGSDWRTTWYVQMLLPITARNCGNNGKYSWWVLSHWGLVMPTRCMAPLSLVKIGSGHSFVSLGRLSHDLNYCWLFCQLDPNRHMNSKILFNIQNFSFKKTYLKMLPAKCVPFCWNLDVTMWNLLWILHLRCQIL